MTTVDARADEPTSLSQRLMVYHRQTREARTNAHAGAVCLSCEVHQCEGYRLAWRRVVFIWVPHNDP